MENHTLPRLVAEGIVAIDVFSLLHDLTDHIIEGS